MVKIVAKMQKKFIDPRQRTMDRDRESAIRPTLSAPRGDLGWS